jgi:two-component system sensor kinase
MRALVVSVFNEVVPEAVRASFTLTVGTLPEAWGDPVLVRQVWTNLIANAVKFTSHSPVKEIEIGGAIEAPNRMYYIKDSGVGFNPAYAGKLFGAFQRLHKPEEFEGNGIGLAIVQRIIHRHGGRVWAEGSENAGATFRFSIPDNRPSTQTST